MPNDKFENFRKTIAELLRRENPTVVFTSDNNTTTYTGKEATLFLQGAATAILMTEKDSEEFSISSEAITKTLGRVQ